MAETSIPVQPAGPPAVQPAPLQLKLTSSADSGAAPGVAPGMVVAQAMCLVDDQGRVVLPMTERTGRRMLAMLTYLCRLTAEASGTIYAPPTQDDDAL